jgi:quercetin dioxygenase-like cupin family protein
MERRIARFGALEVLPAIRELEMPLEVKDVIYSRKLLPAISPEAGDTPIAAGGTIRGAAGMTMTFAVCPPGTGPGLHSHANTFETFTVLDGRFEFSWGDEGEHSVVLERFDVISIVPGVCRGFKNVGTREGTLQVVITGGVHDMNDIAFPRKTAEQIAAAGPEYLEAIKAKGIAFDAGE